MVAGMARTDGPLVAIVEDDELSDDRSGDGSCAQLASESKSSVRPKISWNAATWIGPARDEAAADSYRKCDARRRMIGALSSVRVKARADSTATT